MNLKPSGSPNPAGALPLDGGRLMALLTTHSGSDGPSKGDKTRTTVAGPPQSSMECPRSSHGNTPEVSVPPPAIAPAMQTAPPVNLVLLHLPDFPVTCWQKASEEMWMM